MKESFYNVSGNCNLIQITKAVRLNVILIASISAHGDVIDKAMSTMVRYKNTNVVFPPVLTYIVYIDIVHMYRVHVDIVHMCIIHNYIGHILEYK